MWTRSGTWARVDEVVSAPRDSALASLLEDIGVPTVAPLIASLVPARALGLGRIGLEQLVDRLQTLDLKEGATVEELPSALRGQRRRTALRKELGALVAGHEEFDSTTRNALRGLALWEGSDGRFSSFGSSWLVSRDAVGPFARFSPHAFVVWPDRDAASKALMGVGDAYTVGQALTHLEEAASGDLAALSVREARAILTWFKSRLSKLETAELGRLALLPLIPTERGLRSATETVQAGRFRDPLGLTSILDRRATKGLEQLIAKLGISKLGFADYLREHVAGLDPDAEVPSRALIELIRQCAGHRATIDGNPALVTLLAELSWIPCSDGQRRPPRETYFATPVVREVLGTSPPLVHSRLRPNTAAGDLLRLLGVSDIPRPADIVARVADIVGTGPNERHIAEIVAILRHLSEHAGALDDAGFTPLRSLVWLPAEGEHEWRPPSELYLTFNRNLFSTVGLFIALRRTDQERMRTTLTALGVRSSPPVELVVEHIINLAAAGQAPGPEPLRWLNERASDPHVARLSSQAFLPTSDGRLERPDRVFRHRHSLRPWRAVMQQGLNRFVDLLDALEVAPDPDASTAIDVLLEIADAVGGPKPLDAPTLTVVNRCWEMLMTGSDADLDRLAGNAVVPAADGQLYPTNAVLLEDLPGVDHWLSPAARTRLVPLDVRQQALERAGVGRLSRERRGEILARTAQIEGHWIESRMRERRLQLARIVAGEGGDWHGVVELTQNIVVVAVGAMTVRYRLDNLAALPENPAVDEGAFYDRELGELLVRVANGEPDWQAFAQVVRSEILPGFSPGASLAIKAALAAPCAAAADAELVGYPPLRDEVLAEFERAASGQAGPEESEEEDDIYDVGDDYEDQLDDEGADTESQDHSGDMGDDGVVDQGSESEGREHGTNAHGGQGNVGAWHDGDTGTRTQGSRGTSSGGAGKGRSGDEQGGAAIGKDGAAGRGESSGFDYQLISYVSRNDTSSDASGTTSREQGVRDAVGEAGVDLVIKHLQIELRGSGATIEKMPEKNKGYDILIRDRRGEPMRYIEVKSTEGKWGLRGVGLTEPQFSLAREERDRYWLYVVEHLYQYEAQLWWIRDPAGRVGYFHYDYGWQAVTEGKTWVAGAGTASERQA